ncbi:SDR family oxidoreductase [Psychrobium sp. MM17-31]|uniref:SDR family NAD(P)-dependent oxidoreductase n=1 Tax=Psychrobium sp. MM17-31 TaxID=2917758 RepID=UPI001EF64885|nr:SDR family NAD(P)-dependent oxidoreductase [Psychrobium sp. MM17-31]MCG7533196.1 SDR family oxidoreductase [Psychrobium sp. MM17-31]
MKDKTVLITGAGKGIGRACALMAAKCGANVIAVARTQSDLESLQAEAPDQIEVWVDDVSAASFAAKVKALPQLHGLINNVGTNRVSSMLEQADEDLDAVIDLNLKSLYRTAKAALTPMLNAGGGSIVNMSSQMAYVGSPGRTLYCMSKHGVEGLSKAMGVELAPQGIRVNSVAPTFVLTPLTEPMFEDEAFKSFVFDMIPMKKLATTDDVANACLFLLSDLAAMVTGTCIKVDGGWTAQ